MVLAAFFALFFMPAGRMCAAQEEDRPVTAEQEEAPGDAQAQSPEESSPDLESSAENPAQEPASDAVQEIVSEPEKGQPESTAQEKEKPSNLPPQNIDKEKKITLHFPDTDIRLALETIAAKVGVGIIAGPDVKGKVSIKLEDVPWEKGLDILLKTYGYTYIWEEGVIRVMTRKELREMEMQTQIFKVVYADPLEVEKSVRVVLSKDGAIQTSKETKTLIIKDNPESLKSAKSLIDRLELMAQQSKEQKEGGEPEAMEKSAPGKTEKEQGKKKKSLVLDFKEVPIRDAVAQISALSGVFISVGEEVKSVVTLSTGGKEVPWQKALQEIISASDLAYEPATIVLDNLKAGDFLRIRSKEKVLEKAEKDEKIAERVEVEHIVIQLKYVDAVDIKKILETQLTARGKITILEITGQSGWKFAAESTGAVLQAPERKETKPAKSRTLLLSDIPTSVEKMLKIIKSIDVMPYQIIIEAKFIEVNREFLRDYGFDIASGTAGLSTTVLVQQLLHQKGDGLGTNVMTGGGKYLNDDASVTPFNFKPTTTGLGTRNAGMQLEIIRLLNTQYDMFIRAVEENTGSNVISAPKIMTLNNQEAAIVVGTKYPIVSTAMTTGTTTTTTVDLKYYQDIGVRLNVVPQVSDERYINMIMHPSITSQTGSVTVANTGGFTIASYPILTTREAETQILMKDGETVVIGGLLQDKKFESRVGVPILVSLPLLGPLFSRTTTSVEKIDLLIFITAYVVNKGLPSMVSLDSTYRRLKPVSAEAASGESADVSTTQ